MPAVYVLPILICHFYHAVANHAVAVYIAFLELLGYHILTRGFHPQYASLHCGSSDQMADQPLRLALHLHHPVFYELLVNLIHAIGESAFSSPSGMVARPRSKLSTTGRIFSMMSFAPISYIADFSFLRSFPEIVKFSHRALQAIRQLLDLLIFLILLLGEKILFLFSPSGACASSEEAPFPSLPQLLPGFCFFYLLSFAASAALESISVFAMSLTSLFCTSVLLGIFMIECLIELAL